MDRRLVILGFVVVLFGVAAACGGAAATPTPTPTAGPATTPTATPTVEATPTTGAVDLVALGRSLSARNGCAACHTADGSPGIGSTWKGLYGTEKALADGSTVLVDDAYLHESIVDPDVKIVKGFTAGIMPRGFGDRLSEDELQAIIEYIKTLK